MIKEGKIRYVRKEMWVMKRQSKSNELNRKEPETKFLPEVIQKRKIYWLVHMSIK